MGLDLGGFVFCHPGIAVTEHVRVAGIVVCLFRSGFGANYRLRRISSMREEAKVKSVPGSGIPMADA